MTYLVYFPSISLNGTQKTTINLHQYSQPPSRGLDLPEYKSGMLPVQSGFKNCVIKMNKYQENED